MMNKKLVVCAKYMVVFICCISDGLVYSRTKNKKDNGELSIYQLQGQEGSLCRGPLMPTCHASEPTHVNDYGDIIERVVPSSQGPVIEKVMLYSKACPGSKKHIMRNGLLARYKNAEATILICHGFMCDKFDAGVLRALFPRGKFNFMTFDFRAHGDCPEGQCCTLGRDEKYDVVAAARFLKGHKDLAGKPLIVYGFSMGAVAAIEAQAKDSSLFDAMILDCPFDSTENVLKRSLDNIKLSLFGYEFSLPGRSLLQRYAFHPYVQSLVKIVLKTIAQWDTKKVELTAYPINTGESVKKISVPVFYILCKHDEKVSVAAITSLYQGTASDYKQLWITNGRRHFDSYFYSPEQYTDRVRQFVHSHLKGITKKSLKNEIIQDSDEYTRTLVPLDEKENVA
jgi:pimeloyl-ACP methyl ester carboxylesterase